MVVRSSQDKQRITTSCWTHALYSAGTLFTCHWYEYFQIGQYREWRRRPIHIRTIRL